MKLWSELKKRWKLLSLLALFLLALFAAGMEERAIWETKELTGECGAGEFTAGHRYEQTFTCGEKNLQAVSVWVSTLGRVNDSHLEIRLLEGDVILQSWQVDCRRLAEGSFYKLRLDRPLKDSAGRTYCLQLLPSADATEGAGISAYANVSAGAGGFSVDGEEISGLSLCYRLEYRRDIWNRYAVLAFLFIPFSAAAALAAAAWGGRRTEWCFLVLWLAFSFLYGIANTPFNVPDETAHFYRAFEIAQGHLVSVLDEGAFMAGRALPVDSDLDLLRGSWQSFWANRGLSESAQPAFHNFYNTALYAPVTYLPQALGIGLARLFTDRLIFIFYAGRLFNWACITALLFGALRLLPRGKNFAAFFLLMPMNLQESFSLAPDGMTVALAVFMTALVLSLRERGRGKMSAGTLAILYGLAVAVSLHKIVYMPLCLLYLLIPAERFGGIRKKGRHGILMGVLVVFLNLGWLGLCNGFLLKEGADSALQLRYILHHPLQYGMVVARSLIWSSGDWIEGMAGRYLAWLDVSVPRVLIYLLLFRLGCLLAVGDSRIGGGKSLTGRERDGSGSGKGPARRGTDGGTGDSLSGSLLAERCLLLFLLVSVVLLICTSLYLQWTPPYRLYVEGIQGRYFIPLLLPLYLLFHLRPAGGSLPEEGREPAPVSDTAMVMAFGDVTFLALINGAACISLLFACTAL